MGWMWKFARSSLGAKVLMALTGTVLFGFVLVHMLGNLQVFAGAEQYNAYAHFLKSTGELLWIARAVLLASVTLHIVSGLRLAAINRAARPIGYEEKRYTKATVTSRTMVVSGLLLLSFIVYHLLHFTLGVTDPANYGLLDPMGHHDVYSMLVRGFQNVWVASAYMVSMVLLGMHLNHGASSLFQSLGLNHPRFNGMLNRVGPVFSVLVTLGNISMPAAVLAGYVTLPASAAGVG